MNKFFVLILLLSSCGAAFSMGNPKMQAEMCRAMGMNSCGCCIDCHNERQRRFAIAQEEASIKLRTLTEAATQKIENKESNK